MVTLNQKLDDLKSIYEPYEPPKVKEYKEKAKKALLKKQYKKAYKYLHKSKTFTVIDEFWMI